MPLVLTRNVLPGLKMVNGAEFEAVDVIPDPAFPGYRMANDVTIHFAPTYAVVLASDETRNVGIFGMPTDYGDGDSSAETNSRNADSAAVNSIRQFSGQELN
jgi:hypothetical protein